MALRGWHEFRWSRRELRPALKGIPTEGTSFDCLRDDVAVSRPLRGREHLPLQRVRVLRQRQPLSARLGCVVARRGPFPVGLPFQAWPSDISVTDFHITFEGRTVLESYTSSVGLSETGFVVNL